MSEEMTVTVDGEEYLVRPAGDSMKVGRRVGGDTTWLEDVDVATLPEDARSALEREDSSDAALVLAVRGVVAPEGRPGGRVGGGARAGAPGRGVRGGGAAEVQRGG